MSKNQINFTKISNEATMQLNTFKDSALAIATEDLRYKAETVSYTHLTLPTTPYV